MSYKITIPPTIEPISLEVAKLHLRIDGTIEDDYINNLIQMGREFAENYCNRSLLSQTIETKVTCITEQGIVLPRGVIQSISTIKYKDENETEQTWGDSNYYLNTLHEPNILHLKKGTTTPYPTDGYTITYVAGWTQESDVPAAIKQAILLTIGDMYENRQDVKRTSTSAAQRLLMPYRFLTL